MKHFFVFLLISLGISNYAHSNDSRFFIKTGIGYSNSNSVFKGVASNLGIGYDAFKYLGAEIGINNFYHYFDDEEALLPDTETSTGLYFLINAYPLRYKQHAIDLSVGFGLSMNYWTTSPIKGITYGSMGRYLFKHPIFGAGYYYSFRRFDLGACYRYQHFKYYRDMKNQQFLLTLRKSF